MHMYMPIRFYAFMQTSAWCDAARALICWARAVLSNACICRSFCVHLLDYSLCICGCEPQQKEKVQIGAYQYNIYEKYVHKYVCIYINIYVYVYIYI